MRAIDLHVHLPTDAWLENAIGPHLEATERYFRKSPPRKTLDEVAAEYEALDVLGVVLDWDDETQTGRPWLGNEFMAELSQKYPGVLMGFGSVDPHRDDAAAEVDRAADLGLKGLKLHPTMQVFDPGEERFYPIYERMQERGLVALFHTGTCGIGAGTPGAGGTKIRYSHPGFLDSVAADFPGVTWIAAHFGWPWYPETLAYALHKSNVWIELSGWAPAYLPDDVKREAGKRLNDRTLFGSDYPFIPLERWFSEFEELGYDEAAKEAILRGNAARLLGL